jgi:hypothetical protein
MLAAPRSSRGSHLWCPVAKVARLTLVSQLFFEVWTMTGASSGTTFVLLQLGHRVFAFSRSAIVMTNSNALSHFSHMNS